MYVVLPVSLFAMYQEVPIEIAPASVPYILFAPYVFGILAHWFKKYQLDGLQLGFVPYISQNVTGTLASLVAGLSSLGVMYATEGHGGLFPVTMASWIAAFWIGIGADTINSGMTKAPPAE
jgi:hypothetical protein